MSNVIYTNPDQAAEPRHYGVIIVGGGQAGLSMSYFLKQAGKIGRAHV